MSEISIEKTLSNTQSNLCDKSINLDQVNLAK